MEIKIFGLIHIISKKRMFGLLSKVLQKIISPIVEAVFLFYLFLNRRVVRQANLAPGDNLEGAFGKG